MSLYSVLILIPFAFTARPLGSRIPPAVLLVAVTVGLVIGGPLGGRLADRFSRRMAATTGQTAAGLAFLACAAPLGTALLAPLVVLGHGLGAGLPPLQASAVDAVGREDAAGAASLFLVGRNAGALVGSGLLGLALAYVAPASAFAPGMLAMAVACFLSAAVATRLRGSTSTADRAVPAQGLAR